MKKNGHWGDLHGWKTQTPVIKRLQEFPVAESLSKTPVGRTGTVIWGHLVAQRVLTLPFYLEKSAFIFGCSISGTRMPVPSKYIIPTTCGCRAELKSSKLSAWTEARC